MGFNLNKYKLAQQLPVNEAKTLAHGSPLLEVNNSSAKDRIEILKTSLKDGIYFLGFDQSHVGFIQRKGEQLLIIHSIYIGAVLRLFLLNSFVKLFSKQIQILLKHKYPITFEPSAFMKDLQSLKIFDNTIGRGF